MDGIPHGLNHDSASFMGDVASDSDSDAEDDEREKAEHARGVRWEWVGRRWHVSVDGVRMNGTAVRNQQRDLHSATGCVGELREYVSVDPPSPRSPPETDNNAHLVREIPMIEDGLEEEDEHPDFHRPIDPNQRERRRYPGCGGCRCGRGCDPDSMNWEDDPEAYEDVVMCSSPTTNGPEDFDSDDEEYTDDDYMSDDSHHPHMSDLEGEFSDGEQHYYSVSDDDEETDDESAPVCSATAQPAQDAGAANANSGDEPPSLRELGPPPTHPGQDASAVEIHRWQIESRSYWEDHRRRLAAEIRQEQGEAGAIYRGAPRPARTRVELDLP